MDSKSEFKEFIKNNKELLYKIAEQNTSYNSKGEVIISKDDPWFYEDEWDEIYKNEIKYKKLDVKKLLSKPSKIIPMEESLKDVIPMEWSKEVLNGKAKAIVEKYN